MTIPALARSILSGVTAKFRGQHNRLIAELRRDWGREIARERNIDVIATYHVSVARDQKVVDNQTWQDLGMDDLFAKIDRTAGMPGRQLLYHEMRTYENDDRVLAERARQQTTFMENQALREHCQVLLARLDAHGSEWLASTLLNPFPERPRLAPIFYLCSFLSLGCLVGTIFIQILVIPALILMFANFAITAFYSWRFTPYFAGLSQIVTMLGVSEKLAAIADDHALPQLDCLRKSVPLVAQIRKRLGWLVIDRTALPDLVESALGYLNMFFLFDILVYLRSLAALREHQATLVDIFEAVGSLDSSIAVASYVKSLPSVTRPTLVGDCRLEVGDLYNPLLAAPVSNSLVLIRRSALITGPNMAGKTVFMRTVGINVILAQTLNFCLANRAVIPRAIVRSAIRREDDLAAGQSYFFAEIRQILDFTRAEQAGQCYLFFIDEIFRGTNTIERIAASTAVLRHLARRQIVMATTHDVELQDPLADTFDMYHFNDQVVDGHYSFDYHIQPGPARSRNAIKLLAICGYPREIIDEAEALVARSFPQ